MYKHMMMHWETWGYGPYQSSSTAWRRYVPGSGLWTVCPTCEKKLREHDLRELEVDRRGVRSHIITGIIVAVMAISCIVVDFIAETLAGH